ncbi:MAG: tol-pal system YbgF family protein [Opitutales bacterium]
MISKPSFGATLPWLALLGIAFGMPAGRAQEGLEVQALDRSRELMRADATVEMRRGDSRNQVLMTGIEDGFLYVRFSREGATASFAIENLGSIRFLPTSDSEITRIRGKIGGGHPLSSEELDRLREAFFPLVRFLELPETKAAFQQPVANLMLALVRSGHSEEALMLFHQVPEEKREGTLNRAALELARKLWHKQSPENAYGLLSLLPLERLDKLNVELAFEIASDMRMGEGLEKATVWYRRLADNPNADQRRAQLWQRYCELRQGQHVSDHRFARTLPEVAPGERFFPLQKLVLGIYYQEREQSKEAMRAIAEGIAYATPFETWTPELMYRSAQAYEALEQSAIASAVYAETRKFFPNSPWAQRSL